MCPLEKTINANGELIAREVFRLTNLEEMVLGRRILTFVPPFQWQFYLVD